MLHGLSCGISEVCVFSPSFNVTYHCCDKRNEITKEKKLQEKLSNENEQNENKNKMNKIKKEKIKGNRKIAKEK